MIKELGNEMHKFLKDIKENIKDPEDLKYLLERTEKLFDIVLNDIEKIADYKENEINKLEEKQKEQEQRIEEMQEAVKELCRDVYDEDYGDFEIVCPYCNYEFGADIDETNSEIICPECTNIIELDWDEEND